VLLLNPLPKKEDEVDPSPRKERMKRRRIDLDLARDLKIERGIEVESAAIVGIDIGPHLDHYPKTKKKSSDDERGDENVAGAMRKKLKSNATVKMMGLKRETTMTSGATRKRDPDLLHHKTLRDQVIAAVGIETNIATEVSGIEMTTSTSPLTNIDQVAHTEMTDPEAEIETATATVIVSIAVNIAAMKTTTSIPIPHHYKHPSKPATLLDEPRLSLTAGTELR
jgi:hypothetical protein